MAPYPRTVSRPFLLDIVKPNTSNIVLDPGEIQFNCLDEPLIFTSARSFNATRLNICKIFVFLSVLLFCEVCTGWPNKKKPLLTSE